MNDMSGMPVSPPHEHFRKRVYQRISKDIDHVQLWFDIIEAIETGNGRARFIARLCRRTSRRLWRYDGLERAFFVVYHHDENIPLTILTIKQAIVPRYKGSDIDLRRFVPTGELR